MKAPSRSRAAQRPRLPCVSASKRRCHSKNIACLRDFLHARLPERLTVLRRGCRQRRHVLARKPCDQPSASWYWHHLGCDEIVGDGVHLCDLCAIAEEARQSGGRIHGLQECALSSDYSNCKKMSTRPRRVRGLRNRLF